MISGTDRQLHLQRTVRTFDVYDRQEYFAPHPPVFDKVTDLNSPMDLDPSIEALRLDEELSGLLRTSAAQPEPTPLRATRPGSRRKTRRFLNSKESWLRLASLSLAGVSAFVVVVVSVFGAWVIYTPLQNVASSVTSPSVARCWPMLVFAPWLVASMTILRATLHRRRAVHAWLLVTFFTALAAGLCVSKAPETLTGILVAALPPTAALVCFCQCTGQLTLTRPPQSRPRPDRAHHRAVPAPRTGERL